MTRKTTKDRRLEREQQAKKLLALLEKWEGLRDYWIEQTEHYAAARNSASLEIFCRLRGQVTDACIRELRTVLELPLQPVAAALQDQEEQPDKKSEGS